MSDSRYTILFTGEILPGFSVDTVKANLAALFKSDSSKIEALFSGQPVPLKRNLPDAEADKYVAALQRAGAQASKQREAMHLELVATNEHPADDEPQPGLAASGPGMTCPKCGHVQPSASECSACGIIIEKYLARMAQTAQASPAAGSSPYTPPQSMVDTAGEEYAALKVFSLDGRIGRVRYLGWTMATLLLAGLVSLIAMGVVLISPVLGSLLMLPLVIAWVVVSIQIGVQRLHDMGWSGWLWLLNFVPVANTVLALLLLLMPGHAAANRYGPPPPPNSRGVVALAWSALLIPLLGILAAISIPAYQDYLQRATPPVSIQSPAAQE